MRTQQAEIAHRIAELIPVHFQFTTLDDQLLITSYDAKGIISVEIMTPKGEEVQVTEHVLMFPGSPQRTYIDPWNIWIGGTMLAGFHHPAVGTPPEALHQLAVEALRWLETVAPQHAPEARQRWAEYLVPVFPNQGSPDFGKN